MIRFHYQQLLCLEMAVCKGVIVYGSQPCFPFDAVSAHRYTSSPVPMVCSSEQRCMPIPLVQQMFARFFAFILCVL